MTLDTINRRLRSAERLVMRGTTPGERQAATEAVRRLRARRRDLQAQTDPPPSLRDVLDACPTTRDRAACLRGMAALLDHIQKDMRGRAPTVAPEEMALADRLMAAVGLRPGM